MEGGSYRKFRVRYDNTHSSCSGIKKGLLLRKYYLRLTLIHISVVMGTGQETKRVCLRGNLFSNSTVQLLTFSLPFLLIRFDQTDVFKAVMYVHPTSKQKANTQTQSERDIHIPRINQDNNGPGEASSTLSLPGYLKVNAVTKQYAGRGRDHQAFLHDHHRASKNSVC